MIHGSSGRHSRGAGVHRDQGARHRVPDVDAPLPGADDQRRLVDEAPRLAGGDVRRDPRGAAHRRHPGLPRLRRRDPRHSGQRERPLPRPAHGDPQGSPEDGRATGSSPRQDRRSVPQPRQSGRERGRRPRGRGKDGGDVCQGGRPRGGRRRRAAGRRDERLRHECRECRQHDRRGRECLQRVDRSDGAIVRHGGSRGRHERPRHRRHLRRPGCAREEHAQGERRGHEPQDHAPAAQRPHRRSQDRHGRAGALGEELRRQSQQADPAPADGGHPQRQARETQRHCEEGCFGSALRHRRDPGRPDPYQRGGNGDHEDAHRDGERRPAYPAV